ncbi:uncharacterized protein EI90DRAFT_3054380 [Cantharellus anzutake]|uniref:uncharacterized protein n=1 Tax=Cantharellus anzutake TaxID=1750568 RepID=UPI00190841CB|nr:uncharacterized protein EI90DRAFT_3089297 [Cantharellus anzutake]XP_038917082.1 uncharacterized protein EI90DRAFT_3054380 [Cantharellus anzutake]KAF8314848.1 hypothetical protein EI90DRAFT_3089297 [Cantharellus anzutake]KAF8332788.1 hypothetical protein EI90DRAFT_3054380 [Cantharellus anzutake]
MLITITRDMDQESNYDGQRENELQNRMTRHYHEYDVEESKTYGDRPMFEGRLTPDTPLTSQTLNKPDF